MRLEKTTRDGYNFNIVLTKITSDSEYDSYHSFLVFLLNIHIIDSATRCIVFPRHMHKYNLLLKPLPGSYCSDFRCRNSSHCIDDDLRCDSVENCLDGSDEINCRCQYLLMLYFVLFFSVMEQLIFFLQIIALSLPLGWAPSWVSPCHLSCAVSLHLWWLCSAVDGGGVSKHGPWRWCTQQSLWIALSLTKPLLLMMVCYILVKSNLKMSPFHLFIKWFVRIWRDKLEKVNNNYNQRLDFLTDTYAWDLLSNKSVRDQGSNCGMVHWCTYNETKEGSSHLIFKGDIA